MRQGESYQLKGIVSGTQEDVVGAPVVKVEAETIMLLPTMIRKGAIRIAERWVLDLQHRSGEPGKQILPLRDARAAIS